jgi:hypothetical protein
MRYLRQPTMYGAMTDTKPQATSDAALTGPVLNYETEDGRLKVEARLDNETLWLTQQQIADLCQTSQQNVSLHVQNVFEASELLREATHKELLLVRQEGARQVSRKVDHYNLDTILSVGYCVKSAVATRFRIWATERLRAVIAKASPITSVVSGFLARYTFALPALEAQSAHVQP